MTTILKHYLKQEKVFWYFRIKFWNFQNDRKYHFIVPANP